MSNKSAKGKTALAVSEQSTALTVAERAKLAFGRKEHDAELIALADRSKSLATITNADGYKQVHAARMDLRNERIDLEKRGKAAREDATAFSKAVIAEENRLIALISAEEKRLNGLQEAWDEAREAERLEKLAAEQKRVAAIQERIEAIRDFPDGTQSKTAAEIQIMLDQANAMIIGVDFQEFAEVAKQALRKTRYTLANVRAERQAHEEEQARLAAERAELERQRIEQEEQNRVERERIAEEERVAKVAREAEEARLKAIRDAEIAQVQATLRAERLENERLAREQQARNEAEAARHAEELRKASEEFERIQAEAKAQREAEDAQLAAEREEFERRQAEQRAADEAEEQRRAEQARVAALQRPSDYELIDVLATHYNVPAPKIIEWLATLKLPAKASAA